MYLGSLKVAVHYKPVQHSVASRNRGSRDSLTRLFDVSQKRRALGNQISDISNIARRGQLKQPQLG